MKLAQTKIKLNEIKVKSFVTSEDRNGTQVAENQLNTDYTWVGK